MLLNRIYMTYKLTMTRMYTKPNSINVVIDVKRKLLLQWWLVALVEYCLSDCGLLNTLHTLSIKERDQVAF